MSNFKIGEKVRVVGNGNGGIGTYHDYDNGTEVEVLDERDDVGDYWVKDSEGETQYVNEADLEKIEEPQEFKAGQRVRVASNAVRSNGLGSSTSDQTGAGEVLTVYLNGVDTDGDVVMEAKGGCLRWARPEYLTLVEDAPETETACLYEKGDRVRVTDPGPNWFAGVTAGDTGTVIVARKASALSVNYVVLVEWDNGVKRALFDHRLEKVEVPEGDNDDSPVGEVPAITVASIAAEGIANLETTADMVDHPPHYKFSNGAEVIDITENLTSNGGQAVQYIARSTRLDGNNKGDVLEDLRKAEFFVRREIERIER